MSPQFVDFNSDGHLDIVAGIFDGSPHVAYGSAEGWKQPEQILDRDGQRIMMNAFWNFDTKKWDKTTRCNPEGFKSELGHLTSAVAFDWDADGDLDLLLGDHKEGHVFLRRNEGKAGAPLFATRNEMVLAEGKPLIVPGTVATLRLVDWNCDGLMDLACGSMGDPYGEDAGGGVCVFVNSGKTGAPRFDAPITLVAPSAKSSVGKAERPDSGLYMDFGDADGDGDLDVIVGGFSNWKPEQRVLSAEEQARVPQLEAELKKVNDELQAVFQSIEKQTEGLSEEQAAAKFKEAHAARRPELEVISNKLQASQKELNTLKARPQRTSCVWLYENLQ